MLNRRFILSFVAYNLNILLSHVNAADYTIHKAFNFTWYEARDFCKAYRGELAYINDQTEQYELLALTTYSGNYWIGLNDIATEGTFRWTVGSEASFTDWKSGEPNNAAGGEDCVFMNSGIYYAQWLDGKCTDKKNFICRYSSKKPSVVLTGNIAKGKPTRQKSTSSGGSSSRAVDGRRDTTFKSKSCTHTRKDRNTWWRVDLLAIEEIVKVRITNRGDCCSNRLRHFEIKVGNNANDPNRNELCYYQAASLRKGQTKEIRCSSPKFGRYVFVALRITEYLTLCEVEVYAVGGNMARGMPTKQSSTMSPYGNSSKAVDGKRTTNFHSHSCTHTNYEDKPWWRVDLQWSRDVHRVLLTNRGDCCSDRLAYFDISVGNIDNNPGANRLCYSYKKAIGKSQTKNFYCYSILYGRYVYVQLLRANFLTLCEVEVYGRTGYFNSSKKKQSGGFPPWAGGLIGGFVFLCICCNCGKGKGGRKQNVPAPAPAPARPPARSPAPAPAPAVTNPASATPPPSIPSTEEPAASNDPPAETAESNTATESQTAIVANRNDRNQPELALKSEIVDFRNIAMTGRTASNAMGTAAVVTTVATPYQGEPQPFSYSYYGMEGGNAPIAVLPSSLMPDDPPPSYDEVTRQGFGGFYDSSLNSAPPSFAEFGFEMTPYSTTIRTHSPTAPGGNPAGGIPAVEEHTQAYDNGAYVNDGAGN